MIWGEVKEGEWGKLSWDKHVYTDIFNLEAKFTFSF